MRDIADVDRLLEEVMDSASPSRDGTESLESECTEHCNGPKFESLVALAVSCSDSSGGLNKIPQDWGLELDDEGFETSEPVEICNSSLHKACSKRFRRKFRAEELCLDSGRAVIAMRAAAEGGIDCGSCLLAESPITAALFGFGPLLLRCPSFRGRVGITTGLDGEAGGAFNNLAGFAAPAFFPLLIIGFTVPATPFWSKFTEVSESAGTRACRKARGVTIIVSAAEVDTTNFYRTAR